MSESTASKERNLHLGILLKPDAMVWRYLDFAKFMALLESQCLYFCRADLFQDKHEGSFTRPAIEFREKVWRENMSNISPETFDIFQKSHRFYLEEQKKSFYINCWHMSDYESAAMWEIYGYKDQSIAIQSTYHTLRKLLPTNLSGPLDEKHVDIGLVQYLDYEKDPMPQLYTFDPFLRKRKSFAHEQEVRLFCQGAMQSMAYKLEGDQFTPIAVNATLPPSTGVEFKIDLDLLIQNIYICPTSPIWFRNLVQSMLNRYDIKKEVILSSLNGKPIY